MTSGRAGLLAMGAILALAGIACVSAALWLTTDAYHTVLFFGFGIANMVGAAVLFYRVARD